MSKINRISDITRNIIIRKSVSVLPDRPSERGIKAKDIKDAMVLPVCDTRESVISEINRIVDEINDNTITTEISTEIIGSGDDDHTPTTKALVDYSVPFRLSGLNQINPSSTGFRTSSLYVDQNGSNKKMTIQQIKDLNTKIVSAESMSIASSLDVGDYIYLDED